MENTHLANDSKNYLGKNKFESKYAVPTLMKNSQYFNQLEEKLAATLVHQGEEYLYFGGTAYLGIPQNKDFIALYTQGIQLYGLNNGTSRGNNVQLGIYNEAEDFIAKKFGAAAALITSSGYLAAKLTVQAFAQQGNVRYAPQTHPALWMNGDPKNQQDFKSWATKTTTEINSGSSSHWVLISNSMNNLYPEIYDFSFISNINHDKKVVLIIDDSHGIGILNGGNGVLKNVPEQTNVEVVVVASMAKALGVDAGVVLGNKNIIAQLKQSDEFYGASPPAAAGLYAFMKANDIYKTAFAKLQENVKMFTLKLNQKSEWRFVKDFPVFLCRQPEVNQRLLEEKILISSFPYPDRNGALLNRIVLSSWHSEADILKLLHVLETY